MATLFDLQAVIRLDSDQFENGVKKAEKSGSSLATSLKSGLATAAKVGAAAVGAASAAVGALGGYAVKAGGDFDTAMSEVSAISGATGSELDALREKAKEMGAATKFSASESAEAFKYMSMAGWKTGDMLDGIEGIMNLAAASGENLGEVSDIVTDALTAFGLQASDSAHFADVLAAASNNANTNVSMLGGSFKYVAPVAGALGYSIEDVSVALGLMANSGIKAEQAGTSMRAMLSRLAKPTKDVQDAFASLGMDVADAIQNADGSMKPLSETLDILRNKMSGLTEAQKAQVAAGIAGQEGMSGMLAIINAADSDYQKLSKAIGNADGTAQKMADTMNDNLQGAITILKSAVEGFGITLYETFSGKAQKAVQTLTGYVSQLTDAFNAGGLDGLLSEFDNVLTSALGLVVEKLPKVIKIGSSIVGSLGKSIIRNLPTIVNTGMEVIFQLVDGITNGLPEVVSSMVEVVEKLVQTLLSAETISKIIDSGVNLITTLAESLVSAIPKLVQQVPKIIANIVAALVVQLPNIISAGIDIIFALIDGIIQTIPELVAAVPNLIIGIVNGIINNLDKIILAAPQIILSLIKGLIGAIPELVMALPRVIMSIVDTFKSYDWGNIGKNIVNGIKDGIAKMWGNLTKWFTEKWDSLVGGVKKLLGIHSPSKVFAGIGENMALGLGEGWNGEFDAVKKSVAGDMDFVGSYTPSISTAKANRASSTAEQNNTDALLTAILNKLDGMGVYLDGTTLTGYVDSSLGRKTEQNKRLALA